MRLPLKYKGQHYNDWGGKFSEIEDADGEDVVGEWGGPDPEESVELVNMVNAYPKLVECLIAALKYIEENPCDPDIYKDQLEAWNKLQDLQPYDFLKSIGEGH